MGKLEMIGCYGNSQKTGKRVGSRHRWGTRGEERPRAGSTCEYCGRVHNDATYGALRLVAGDRIPPYVDDRTSRVYRTEVRHCVCGGSLLWTRRV